MVGWEAGLIGVYDHRDNMPATGRYIPCFHPSIMLMYVAQPFTPRYSPLGEFPLHVCVFFVSFS